MMKEYYPAIIKYAFYGLLILGAGINIYHNIIYPFIQLLKKKNEGGYILTKLGALEHRVIAEELIGRKLLPGLVVHHINGKRWDNRKRNLAVMTDRNHNKWHERLSWMYSQKMFPKIPWQRKKLIEEFGAILF